MCFTRGVRSKGQTFAVPLGQIEVQWLAQGHIGMNSLPVVVTDPVTLWLQDGTRPSCHLQYKYHELNSAYSCSVISPACRIDNK